MFKFIEIGDLVGLSTSHIDEPYKMIKVVDVYETFISITQPCDNGALFNKHTGRISGFESDDLHILPYAAATLQNQLALSDTQLAVRTALSHDFEQQIDRIKSKFYKTLNPTDERLSSLIQQLSNIQ